MQRAGRDSTIGSDMKRYNYKGGQLNPDDYGELVSIESVMDLITEIQESRKMVSMLNTKVQLYERPGCN